MGREAYHNPYILNEVDKLFFDDDHVLRTRHELLQSMQPYIESELKKGHRLNIITRHIMGLFHAQAGAKLWRRYLSENGTRKDADWRVVEEALKKLIE